MPNEYYLHEAGYAPYSARQSERHWLVKIDHLAEKCRSLVNKGRMNIFWLLVLQITFAMLYVSVNIIIHELDVSREHIGVHPVYNVLNYFVVLRNVAVIVVMAAIMLIVVRLLFIYWEYKDVQYELAGYVDAGDVIIKDWTSWLQHYKTFKDHSDDRSHFYELFVALEARTTLEKGQRWAEIKTFPRFIIASLGWRFGR